jgi:ribosomal protein S18 acetylase RimI-like enzyme
VTSAQAPAEFKLPAALRAQGYALRPETDDDIPFLLRLYASTRAQELARVLDWSAEHKQAFLASQFQAQRRHYRTQFAECTFDILEHDRVPGGRLYLDVRRTRLHIVDISLLPEWRGKGLGSAILQALMAAGQASGLGIGIFVEKFNPALRLYRRLGFTEIDDHGVYLEMQWLPQAREAVS